MNIGSLGGAGETEMCAGGLFDVGSTEGGQGGNAAGSSSSIPAWIVGDVFLKNVYTVFQGNPPAVGFAQLASGLNSEYTLFSLTVYRHTNLCFQTTHLREQIRSPSREQLAIPFLQAPVHQAVFRPTVVRRA